MSNNTEGKGDRYPLIRHIKRQCQFNLKNNRMKRCATCPFEDLITEVDPTLKDLFKRKRYNIKKAKEGLIELKFK
jgi:hypothetical protein